MTIGEWWITNDADTIYADGDVGDYNHEGVVQEHMYSQLISELNGNTDTALMWTYLNEVVKEYVADEYDRTEVWPYPHFCALFEKEYLHTMSEEFQQNWKNLCHEDLREYAAEHWGWIAVKYDNISVWELTEATFKTICRGMNDIFEQQGIDEEDETIFQIFSAKEGRLYSLSMHEIESENWTVIRTQMEPQKVASDSLRRQEIAAQHPCYKNTLGD